MATQKKEVEKEVVKPKHAERLAAFKESDEFKAMSRRDQLYYDRKPEGEVDEWHMKRIEESEKKAGA